MDKWQQDFSSKLNCLREGWSEQFEDIACDLLDPIFTGISEFVRRCDMQPATFPEQKGMRSYKFGLCEDAYVMLYFRPKGVDQIECDYECFLPRAGKVSGVKSSASARSAERPWAEGCFRMALDDLVSRFSEARKHAHDAELALAQ
jgi:hypothetical protein